MHPTPASDESGVLVSAPALGRGQRPSRCAQTPARRDARVRERPVTSRRRANSSVLSRRTRDHGRVPGGRPTGDGHWVAVFARESEQAQLKQLRERGSDGRSGPLLEGALGIGGQRGVPAPRPVRRRVHELSGGNPLHARGANLGKLPNPLFRFLPSTSPTWSGPTIATPRACTPPIHD